mgnify:CR=1 FL=1
MLSIKTAGLVIDVMHANDQVGHRMDYIGKSLIMQGIGSLLSFIVVFGLLNSLEGALLLMTVVTYRYRCYLRLSEIKSNLCNQTWNYPSEGQSFPMWLFAHRSGRHCCFCGAEYSKAVFILYIRRFCSRHLCISCCSRGNYPNGCDYIYNPLLGYLVERYYSREKSFFYAYR